MRRLPIKVRLTLAFALAMAVLLAAAGFFVYRHVAGDLSRSLETVRGLGYRLRKDGGTT